MVKKWRIWTIVTFFLMALIIILVRLFFIQIVSTRAFSQDKIDLIQLAQQNQNREIVIDSGRGMILDRKGSPLVGEKKWRILAFPQSENQLKLKEKELKALADLIEYPYEEFSKRLTRIRQPFFLGDLSGKKFVFNQNVVEELKSLHIPGLVLVESDHRNAMNQVAQQVVGRVARNPFIVKERYLDQGHKGLFQQARVGVSGLESSFDVFLHGKEENVLIYTKDRTGKPLNGIQVRTKQKEGFQDIPPYTIQTTIDQDMQRKAEKVLAEENVKEGAVVVQDISNGNVLAMASRPANEDSTKKNTWDNRALMEMTPGSIFKIVVAVGALEEGIVTPYTKFKCVGKLDRYHMKDAKRDGHGYITFETAFSKSCNVVISQVAEKLGGERLEEYAKRLGLGKKIVWSGPLFKEKDFRQIHEQAGIIFSEKTSKKDLGAVAQTGIGQRDTKVTPLQAANMITSILHQGLTISPRLVTELKGADGKVYPFQQKVLEKKPLKKSTVSALKRMMRKVVTEGTARSLNYAKIPLAGKTGTAQIGNKLYHKWMIGYGPTLYPKYSVAVVIAYDPDWKGPQANRIFRKVMEAIHQK